MLEHGYVSDVWKDIFEFNGVGDFTTLWRISQENTTTLHPHSLELKLPHGGRTKVILKQLDRREQPHWRILFKKSSLANEIQHLLLLKKNHIITTEPVYYWETPDKRALLVVCELTHFISLEQLYSAWQQTPPDFALRRGLIKQIATIIRHLHQLKRCHRQLSHAHIWIRYSKSDGKRKAEDRLVGLTQLDAAKRYWFKSKNINKELGQLLISSAGWRYTDKLRFFLCYREHEQLSSADKRLIRRLLKRATSQQHTKRTIKLSQLFKFRWKRTETPVLETSENIQRSEAHV